MAATIATPGLNEIDCVPDALLAVSRAPYHCECPCCCRLRHPLDEFKLKSKLFWNVEETQLSLKDTTVHTKWAPWVSKFTLRQQTSTSVVTCGGLKKTEKNPYSKICRDWV